MAVKSVKVTSSSTAVSAGCKVLGIYVDATGAAGSFILKDGGSGGTSLLSLGCSCVADTYCPVPGGGMVFDTDCYAALTTVTSITIFYEDLT